jgi:hypothetical protein
VEGRLFSSSSDSDLHGGSPIICGESDHVVYVYVYVSFGTVRRVQGKLWCFLWEWFN